MNMVLSTAYWYFKSLREIPKQLALNADDADDGVARWIIIFKFSISTLKKLIRYNATGNTACYS